MKVNLESTTKIVEVNGIPARIWEGETDLVKFDRAAEVAEQIKLVLMGVDVVIQNGVGSEELSGMVAEMRRNNDTLHAWPFPKTLNTAAKRDKELDVFDAIVELIHAREAQREHKDPFVDDERVAEMFGL